MGNISLQGKDPILASDAEIAAAQRAGGASSPGRFNFSVNGIRHSILTLTSTAVGGGILSISYMVHLCGVGLGLLMLIFGATLSYVSIVVLMQMSTEGRHDTYAGLFSHCAGWLAGPILDAMLFIYGAGACVGYFV